MLNEIKQGFGFNIIYSMMHYFFLEKEDKKSSVRASQHFPQITIMHAFRLLLLYIMEDW